MKKFSRFLSTFCVCLMVSIFTASAAYIPATVPTVPQDEPQIVSREAVTLPAAENTIIQEITTIYDNDIAIVDLVTITRSQSNLRGTEHGTAVVTRTVKDFGGRVTVVLGSGTLYAYFSYDWSTVTCYDTSFSIEKNSKTATMTKTNVTVKNGSGDSTASASYTLTTTGLSGTKVTTVPLVISCSKSGTFTTNEGDITI